MEVRSGGDYLVSCERKGRVPIGLSGETVDAERMLCPKIRTREGGNSNKLAAATNSNKQQQQAAATSSSGSPHAAARSKGGRGLESVSNPSTMHRTLDSEEAQTEEKGLGAYARAIEQ